MSEKKKLGRGLAGVMDVYFPSEPVKEQIEPKEEKKTKIKKEEKSHKVCYFSLKDNISLLNEPIFPVEIAISDNISHNLTPYEDVVYNKLYRLSYGEGKNYCQIGYGGIIESTSLKCARTAKIAIEGLIKKKYIGRIKIDEKERKGKGTLYRIFRASEIISGKTVEGIELEQVNTGEIEAFKTID